MASRRRREPWATPRALSALAIAFLKERINLKALKLLGSCSRLACRCDALVFLFYRSPVTPLPERSRNTLLRYYAVAGGYEPGITKLLPQKLSEMFPPVSLEIAVSPVPQLDPER